MPPKFLRSEHFWHKSIIFSRKGNQKSILVKFFSWYSFAKKKIRIKSIICHLGLRSAKNFLSFFGIEVFFSKFIFFSFGIVANTIMFDTGEEKKQNLKVLRTILENLKWIYYKKKDVSLNQWWFAIYNASLSHAHYSNKDQTVKSVKTKKEGQLAKP
jgi:hypothetical protein